MAAVRNIFVSPYTSSYTWARPHSSFDRIHLLAQPKRIFCESSPTHVWGTQETIWTLSGGAMTARPSARILALSRPKKDFSECQCRCRPVIGGRPPPAKFGYPSERLLKLSQPKQYHPDYLLQKSRDSPEWPVSQAAQNYNASERILELARPKELHPDFVPAREVPTPVSRSATSAIASPRLQRLAKPLIRQMACCPTHSHPKAGELPITKASQKAIASPRTLELAVPKKLHAKYILPRDPEWTVTAAAKRAVATPRLVELAKPCSRPPMGVTSFNPNAFRVKESAKKATCSPRIEELARPIER